MALRWPKGKLATDGLTDPPIERRGDTERLKQCFDFESQIIFVSAESESCIIFVSAGLVPV